MVDLIESRIVKLTGISAHWRQIANGILATTVNGAIRGLAAPVSPRWDDYTCRARRRAGQACACEAVGQ